MGSRPSTQDRLLFELKGRSVRILEIGIQNNGSLEIWSKDFPQASKIVGYDLDETCRQQLYSDPRIGVIVGDANSDVVELAIAEQPLEFNIIIDDGSSISGDMIRSFVRPGRCWPAWPHYSYLTK